MVITDYNQPTIIICPGIHEPALTESFILGLLEQSAQGTIQNPVNILVFPGEGLSALSAFHILGFLHEHLRNRLESSVVFISFSAGVVGAIGAACSWQLLYGQVKAFIAIDGWGMPLGGSFPIHRMSHDYFTHWSSCLLGGGHNNFYASPPVDHLSMWRSPQTVQGYWVDSSLGAGTPSLRVTAAEFLQMQFMVYK